MARARVRIGDPLPAVLTLSDLVPVFNLSYKRLWELQSAGDLVRFELQPPIGDRARYSGKKIQNWLDGNSAPVSRFFQKGVTR